MSGIDWFTTISLIFGGCCSNAISLERLTSNYPNTGSLLTFFQFLTISLYGLPKHLIWTPYGPRFKPRKIPLTPYLIQVALFSFISLLNNAAFAYSIPMTVHIIFRSGGLVISMLLGWVVAGKRYTIIQVFSVILVTFGVAITTLSASQPARMATSHTRSTPYIYFTGIAILTLALLLSGFLGLVQDHTHSRYSRPNSLSPPPWSKDSDSKVKLDDSPAWQESMFYLHFFALPIFVFIWPDLLAQFKAISSDTNSSLSIPLRTTLPRYFHLGTTLDPTNTLAGTINIPTAYLSLMINTLTQLLCVAGVHRLTTRVSALSVTLVLVARKAVSLIFSAIGMGGVRDGANHNRELNAPMMWSGAFIVLIGTVTYSIGTKAKTEHSKDKEE